MYAGYQHPGGYYDEQQQQAFDPYAVPPEGYQQGFFPQNATAYGYPAQQQQYYAPYGMAAGYGYDPSMMAASMPPAMGGMTYPAQQTTMGMQPQQQQQYQPQQMQQPQPQTGQATSHRPASSTPSNSSSMRPNASSNGAASGNNTQQSHLAAGAGAKHMNSTLDPSISAAPTTSASPSSTSSPRPQGQAQGSLGSSLGGLSSLPPRPNFEPATSQFSTSVSSNHINGAALNVPAMPAPALAAPQHASGSFARPAAVPRLGSQMMMQQQSEGGASSISNKGNVLGVQLLDKLPPLPPLPAMRQDVPAALSWLQSSAVAKGGSNGDGKELGQNAAPSVELDADAQSYIASLHEAVQAYQRREEAMQLRLEAMAFRPTESWTALRIERGDEEEPEVAEKEKADGDVASSSSSEPRPPASVLGVRLLRKVTELQRENGELGALLSKKLGLEETEEPEKGEAAVTVNGVPPKGGEVDKLLGDLEDAHSLLSSLSTALTNAETRASKAEAALQFAVQSRSKGIMDRSDSAASLSSSPPQQPRHHHSHHQQQQSQQVAGAPSAPRQQGPRQHQQQQQQRAGKPKQKDGKTAAGR